jgi:hypothetical protein
MRSSQSTYSELASRWTRTRAGAQPCVGRKRGELRFTASSTLEIKRAGGKVALAGLGDDYLPVSFAAEAILSNYRLEERYAEFVSNEAQVAGLRPRLEHYAGPVTNAGSSLIKPAAPFEPQ